MAEEKEIRLRILKKAEEMFLQFGYSKVTMDEVATELGMSKKTLYKFFPSKEHLIRSMIFEVKCEISEYVDNLFADEAMDFVEKLKKLMNFLGKQSSKLRGPLLHDLQKTIPEIWEELNEFRKTHAYEKFNELLTRGKKAGAFRDDIDQQFILLTYVSTIQGVINPDLLVQLPYTGEQVFQSLIKIIFEGILSEEGRAKYMSGSVEENKT